MRFDDLFDDLESQLEAEQSAEERDVLAEEERFRLGRLDLRDRLLRAPRSLELRLREGTIIRMDRVAIGKDWCSGQLRGGGADGAGCIVPLHAIGGVRGGRETMLASLEETRESTPLTVRLSLGFAIRDLARRRVAVEVRCPTPIQGTFDRVGRDHADLAIHEAGTSRSERNVRGYEIVPFAAIDWIRIPD